MEVRFNNLSKYILHRPIAGFFEVDITSWFSLCCVIF